MPGAIVSDVARRHGLSPQHLSIWRKAVRDGFRQIKQARGFRQFLLPGLANVRAEWAMICTAHNLVKLANLARPHQRDFVSKCANQKAIWTGS